MLAAKSGGKTVFEILCHGLENAAFHEWTHVLNKFLRLAWLKPLKSQGGDFKIPCKLNMTLLALAVLVQSHEVGHFLDSGDPLEVIYLGRGHAILLRFAFETHRFGGENAGSTEAH